ncbi:hypothetical protein QBC46DRAFT_386758 [Diplogelasinospora grovesii]|uniref:2EXR domain-containing protein n=1 Tax=Diplogelasinospora grovesii TaxID=303347 RepID=A0AAN6N606_9PEZI|nr:hypothetical protein QBC46DRAFT_386758 [Diplogelasinospora grovesii]
MTTFTLFPYLPTELRLDIWRRSCQPRVVEVRYDEEQDKCVTTTTPPAVLQVCRESRYECATRIYVRAFGTNTDSEGRIYFAPRLDILYISRCGAMGYGDVARDFGLHVKDTTQHVRRLAIDHVAPAVRRPWETYNKFCLMRNFAHLEETYLVVEKETPQKGATEIELLDPRTSDREAIRRLMEHVRDSFTYEVGPGLVSLDGWTYPNHSVRGTGRFEPPLFDSAAGISYSLIPKRKRRNHPYNTRHKTMYVACV